MSVKILGCAVLCILFAGCLFAQNNTGTIQGSVTDPSGAVLSGAAITVRNMDTGSTATSRTTNAGVYSVPNLVPGRYSVTVEAPGMRRYSQSGITIRTSTTTTVDVTTQLGEVSKALEVSADAVQLETATSDLGVRVEPTLIQKLP